MRFYRVNQPLTLEGGIVDHGGTGRLKHRLVGVGKFVGYEDRHGMNCNTSSVPGVFVFVRIVLRSAA